MAMGGLLALLDDLTVLMDDIAAMSKVAAGKTVGISGDDLAVNAEVLSGIDPKRELPIVWAVAKGSLRNKGFLVPGALFLNWTAPWAITPILMAGAVFLCFEGFEKILHARDKMKKKDHQKLAAAAALGAEDLLQLEKDKIRQAINTDLILSAEIVAIALGTVATEPFVTQVSVLVGIALVMTIGVYGLVAGIVKLDDVGLYYARKKNKLQRAVGQKLVTATPTMMKGISIIGTAAMFMVGGGILVHGIAPLHHLVDGTGWKIPADIAIGLIAGALAVAAMHRLEKPLKRLFARLKTKKG